MYSIRGHYHFVNDLVCQLILFGKILYCSILKEELLKQHFKLALPVCYQVCFLLYNLKIIHEGKDGKIGAKQAYFFFYLLAIVYLFSYMAITQAF